MNKELFYCPHCDHKNECDIDDELYQYLDFDYENFEINVMCVNCEKDIVLERFVKVSFYVKEESDE